MLPSNPAQPWKFAIILLMTLWACERPKTPPAQPSLITALVAVDGKFDWRSDLNRYIFTAPEQIETIVAAATPNIAVPILVDCIDNQAPSHATLNGVAVAVGMVCYQALSQTASHEETAPNGDIASAWAGHIEPTSTIEQRIAAKRAWQIVLKEKTYGLL